MDCRQGFRAHFLDNPVVRRVFLIVSLWFSNMSHETQNDGQCSYVRLGMGVGSVNSDDGRIGIIASPNTEARIEQDKRASTIKFDLPIFSKTGIAKFEEYDNSKRQESMKYALRRD